MVSKRFSSMYVFNIMSKWDFSKYATHGQNEISVRPSNKK
jgi:hypothetical protein